MTHTYQPKGGLCVACAKRQHDCSGLPFATMPPLHTYDDGVTVVKRTAYERPIVKQTGATLTKPTLSKGN